MGQQNSCKTFNWGAFDHASHAQGLATITKTCKLLYVHVYQHKIYTMVAVIIIIII